MPPSRAVGQQRGAADGDGAHGRQRAKPALVSKLLAASGLGGEHDQRKTEHDDARVSPFPPAGPTALEQHTGGDREQHPAHQQRLNDGELTDRQRDGVQGQPNTTGQHHLPTPPANNPSTQTGRRASRSSRTTPIPMDCDSRAATRC